MQQIRVSFYIEGVYKYETLLTVLPRVGELVRLRNVYHSSDYLQVDVVQHAIGDKYQDADVFLKEIED